MIPHCTDEVYWYNYDLTFDKTYKKCVYALEKTIRSTLEYDLWAKNCKINSPDAVNCPICGDNYYEKSCKCDTHHHPRTLYCIVDDVLSEMVDNNKLKETTAFDIVKEVTDGKFEARIQEFGIKENGVGTTDFEFTKDKIGEENIKKLNQIKEEIKNGKVVVKPTL